MNSLPKPAEGHTTARAYPSSSSTHLWIRSSWRSPLARGSSLCPWNAGVLESRSKISICHSFHISHFIFTRSKRYLNPEQSMAQKLFPYLGVATAAPRGHTIPALADFEYPNINLNLSLSFGRLRIRCQPERSSHCSHFLFCGTEHDVHHALITSHMR